MEPVEVKVTYKYPSAPSQEIPIVVDVEVYRQKDKIYVGGVCLGRGIYRLFWTLTGDPLEVSCFTFSEMPSNVTRYEEAHWDEQERKWTALFENNRDKDDPAAAFTYTFECTPLLRSLRFVHDPTIAVTNDPPPNRYQP